MLAIKLRKQKHNRSYDTPNNFFVMFFGLKVLTLLQVEHTPNMEGGGSGDQNTEFYLLPICQESCESSESETSKKTDDEASSKTKNADSESPKTKKTDGESSQSKKTEGETPKKPKTSKRRIGSTPFGETNKSDSDSFYVDIIYAVLHMIGESKF